MSKLRTEKYIYMYMIYVCVNVCVSIYLIDIFKLIKHWKVHTQPKLKVIYLFFKLRLIKASLSFLPNKVQSNFLT